MEYRVVEKDAFYLMGKTGYIPLIYHGPNPHTANVWKQLKQEDLLVLMEYSEVDPKGVICAYGGPKDDPYSYREEGTEVFMCVGVVMEKPMPDRFKGRFDVFPYEASTWLVFPATDNTKDGMNTQQIWKRVTEWLPASEYEESGAPTILWGESYDFSKPDKKSEIWVPVCKRKN